MKIKLLQIGFVSLLLSLATGCSSALYQSDAYALDDMYGVVDQEALSRQRAEEARARQAAAEEARARQAAEAEALQAFIEAYNASNSASSNTYESVYARRLRGFDSPTYQRSTVTFEGIQSDSRFEYLSAYNPAYHTFIIVGDRTEVEPRYISSMFDSWSSPSVYFNFGFSSYYSYNDFYFGWRYYPYSWINSPAWFWPYGGYNPYALYPWNYPYWDPFWYYPPYWGYGPGCWWGHHHHYPSYPGHIVSRPNYRQNQSGYRMPSGSFSNSGYRGTSSTVGRGSFSGNGGSSSFRGGSSSSSSRPSNSYRPNNGSSSSSSFRNNSSSSGSSTFRSNSSSSFSPASNTNRSSYSTPTRPSLNSGSSFRGSSGGSFSRGSSGGGSSRSYGR